MGMCYIDKDSGTEGLTDEQIKEYEGNTKYHPETTTEGEIRKTNTSSVQFNINRGRK